MPTKRDQRSRGLVTPPMICVYIQSVIQSPMRRFAELGVEEIASFFICFLYMEIRVIFDHVKFVYVLKIYEEKFVGCRWSFSWLGQKVNIAVAGVALTGGVILINSAKLRGSGHFIMA